MCRLGFYYEGLIPSWRGLAEREPSLSPSQGISYESIVGLRADPSLRLKYGFVQQDPAGFDADL